MDSIKETSRTDKGRFVLKDRTGIRYSYCVAISYAHIKREAMWNCLCDCGNMFISRGTRLENGSTKSCGCWHKRKMITHGYTKNHKTTLEYKSWSCMKYRCSGKSERFNKYYKDKGIVICDRWIGDDGFTNFLEDMGNRPTPKHSLDRIDNNGNYCKENCKWSSSKEQMNNVSTNRLITYNGETKTVSQWADVVGINNKALARRLTSLNWSIEKSLKTPLIPNGQGRNYK